MAINGLTGGEIFSLSKDSFSKDNNKKSIDIPFANYLSEEIQKTDELIKKSDKIAETFAAGKTDNLHEVLIAAEKASIALQFTIQIRNKIMDAYNEIMRMQI
jgi:flagellar hook-basal body complex protein FliE